MNPAVKRLGSVRIERLETPKDVSVKQKAKKSNLELNDSLSEEENEDSEEVFTSEVETDEEGLEIPIPQSSLSGGSGNLKRTSDELKLGPDISFKKFKPDNEKNKPSLTTHNEKKIDDDTESSSEEDDSFYDSELESEDDDRRNNDLGNGAGNNVKKFDNESQNKVQVKSDVNIDNEKLNKAENHEDRLEKTEENSSNDNIIKEPHDEEYDKDIKKKLKEMGEITFATVKKGEKPKTDSPPSTENEVVITKKSGEEVTVVSKGNLRRNIREVMDETKLDETTLAAQRQEAERLKRVQDQQRLLREYQKQAQQERTQQRVMSLLQGNIYAKPGPSNANKVGGTVLVKLPNGQTAPMTKVSRPEFDILKVPRPEPFNTVFHPQNTSMNQIRPTAPFQMASTRTIPAKPPHSGIQLPPSLSLSPISKKLPSKSFSNTDSDSENEEAIKEDTLKHKIIDQTIEVSSDDDCIVVSESECEQNDEDEPDDPCNSGMHTNDEFNLPDDQGRVLVNVGHPEDEPDVIIAPQIAKIIKPHQIGGVRFLYDNIVETVTRFDPGGGFGCILAHSMGLGKTLQIVTFSDLFLRYTPAKKILCIMPINTLQNWMAEFNIWTPTVEAAAQSALNAHGDVRPRNFNLHVLNDSHKTLVARQKVIRAWNSQGGVLMIGYEQFRLLSMRKTAKKKRNKTPPAAVNLADEDKNKPIFDEIYLALVNPGADLVICDEGHRIKNSHASISAALKQLRTKRRVVLTGYPLQNNLTEYWCMVDFVRPNYLGSKTEFLNMFERPIMNGQCIDSTESDIKLMRYRAHVLHSLLVGFVQRRSHTVLQTVLPKKEEYVLLVRLKPFQRKLYDRFMNDVVRTQNVPNPLKAFAVCCKIWNHPDVLYNFLVKRAQGEAVDLDLEEVGTVSGVSTAGETTKPTKRGSAKSRKTPAKGRNGKPAASVTPYNSTPESAGTSINKLNDGNPPQFNNVNIGGSRIPAVTNFHENGTNFHSATNNRIPASTSSHYNFNENDPINKDGKYGPYMNEFNQPRTSFEGISQFFGDYEKNAVSNTQYPQFANNSNQNNFTENQIESRLFNMDQKNTVSVSNNNSNNQNHQNFDQFGYHPQTYWESENKLEFNQSWIKKEDDSTEESKNKINIISDVKLNTAIPGTEDKKINIISDIKLEPKNEEEIKFDNFEQINIKKVDEDEDVKVVENSLTKLVSLSALKDSKEDSGIPYEWAIELLKDYLPGQIENAAKFQILFCIIKESLALGDRLLVFSQSLITLDLIEQFLQMSEIPGQTYKWLRNSSYYRLDGSTGAQEREKLINEFNSNPKIFLFLVSTRAGSLGINLIGANRVIVLDASWNPCHDTQAVCRVYRYGQRKPCFVYRLVVDNCLEKKIYDRQVSKQGMSDRVVDECNPDAHLTIKDVTSLCYDDDKNDDEEERIKDWSSLKYSYIDVVLQKVLDKYGATLSKKPFHHESLLIDRKEKKLSQQEKRLAKKGYERDKNAARQPAHHSNGYGRGQRPVASVRPMPQLADRPTRWIPAEHWQRQGMTAQEMTLPLDVVIPTNQRKKGNIVLKAGQKVLVLKSPKGVYMQLESGKIVAIKTAIKVKGRADDNINDPPLTTTNNIPIAGRPSSQIQRPPQVQNNVAKDFMPGYVKFNVKSARRPSLPNNHFASKMQNRRTNIPTAGNHHQFVNSHNDSEIIPGSSSEEEAESDKNSGVAELEKKISHLNKSISMRHRNTIPQTVNFKESPIMERNISKQTNNMVFNNSSSYQETLDNLTSTTTTTNLFPQNNVENVDSDDEDFDEYRSIEKDVVEKQNEEISPELTLGGINQLNNEADSIFQTSMINKANYQTMQPKIEPSSSSSTEPNNQPNNYGYNYDYNIPTYQTQSLPLAQGFTYAPQPSQPSQFDNYGNYQPAGGEYHHHYGYENFPNSQQQQPHYVAQPPNFSDYNNAVVPTTVVNYQEQNYSPYPPPPGPQNIYQQPSNSYPDYVQFPSQNPSSVPQIPHQQSSNNYYQGS